MPVFDEILPDRVAADSSELLFSLSGRGVIMLLLLILCTWFCLVAGAVDARTG